MRQLLLFLAFISLWNINALIHAEVVLDGTLGPSGALPGPNYFIGADLGQQHGGNLFHSFRDFNLSRGDSATFSGPNSVHNIIGRVTGGNPSNIDGLIRSTIPNADMYFLNPYGIMFGPNARLDVQGSFHASTADYLRLGQNGRFDARQPNNSLLTVAPVEAFGFLDNTVAPIFVEGRGEIAEADWDGNPTGLSVLDGKTLSLIGGTLEFNNGTFFKTVKTKTVDDEVSEWTEITRLPSLSARSGRINLASVGSTGEVLLGGSFLDMSSFTKLADIHLTEKSLLQTSGEGGGSLFIRGGQFFADDSAIEAKTLGNKDGGVIDIRADAISLTHGATLNGNTEGTGKGTDINLRATDFITVIGENSEAEESSAIYAGSGIADELTDDNLGDAGQIVLEAKNISFKEGALISTDTYGGGKGGDVTLRATESVRFSGESNKEVTRIYLRAYSKSEGAGDGGNLLIEANNISFENGAVARVSTHGKGNGGIVAVHAKNRLKLTGVSKNSKNNNDDDRGSRIYVVNREDTGNAGDLFVEAQEVLLTDGAYLISVSFGSGNSGNVHVHATGTVTIAGADKKGWVSGIGSASNPKDEGTIGGESGNVTIEAEQLFVKDGGNIGASSIAPKGTQGSRGGSITIRVTGAIELSGVNPYGENEDGFGAGIYARSIGVDDNAGEGGKIVLQAGSLIIKDGAAIKSSTNNNAPGGNIEILMRGTVTITGDASKVPLKKPASAQVEYLEGFQAVNPNQSTSGIYVNSDSTATSAGNSGTIELKAGQLVLNEGGRVEASTSGGGLGGNINIHVDGLTLIAGEGSEVSYSGIFTGTKSQQNNAGHGGNIKLHAGELMIGDGAAISASTFGAGLGGKIDIQVNGPITIVDSDTRGEGSFIGAGAWGSTSNAGDGGDLVLEAKELHIVGGAAIEAGSTGPGRGGNIFITVTDRTTLSGKKSSDGKPSRILTASEGQMANAGDAGAIVLETGELYLTDNTSIAVSSRGPGRGGNLTLTAQHINVVERSKISASSTGGGNAGNLFLQVGERLYMDNRGAVTTATTRADGGNITITTPGYLYLINSKITTSVAAKDGNGGNITLSPAFIVQDSSKIIARAVGGNGGNIDITTTGIYKFPPDSKSSIDASSQFGVDGIVVVNSLDADVSGQLIVLPSEFIDVTNQLQLPCSARIAENLSSFVMVVSEGAANMPGDLLPSGPRLSPISPLKIRTSMDNKAAKRYPTVARLTGCQPLF